MISATFLAWKTRRVTVCIKNAVDVLRTRVDGRRRTNAVLANQPFFTHHIVVTGFAFVGERGALATGEAFARVAVAVFGTSIFFFTNAANARQAFLTNHIVVAFFTIARSLSALTVFQAFARIAVVICGALEFFFAHAIQAFQAVLTDHGVVAGIASGGGLCAFTVLQAFARIAVCMFGAFLLGFTRIFGTAKERQTADHRKEIAFFHVFLRE